MTKLEILIEKLSQIHSFVGSVPYNYSRTTYMKLWDIEQELLRRYIQFDEMKNFKGCGELTKNEKNELVLLDEYFNDEYEI